VLALLLVSAVAAVAALVVPQQLSTLVGGSNSTNSGAATTDFALAGAQTRSINGVPVSSLESGKPPLGMLGQFRRYARHIGRRIGLLERKDHRLGFFEAGGAGGRCPPPAPLPFVLDGAAPGSGLAAEPADSAHVPIHTHLLSRDLWAKHLSTQAASIAAERAAYDAAVASANLRGPRLSWSDNPWRTNSLASITLFSMYPDLHLHSDASPSSDPAVAQAQQEQMALYLLAISSWVELLPSADKVHLFVNRPETCMALVGHDGSDKSRQDAMERAKSSGNKLAAVRCKPFPCVHPEYKRGLISCVWNDVFAVAEAEATQRRSQLRTERSTLLESLRSSRPVTEGGKGLPAPLDENDAPLAWSASLDAELEALLAEAELEDEVMLYVSPESLLDLQMLTVLSKLSRDALSTRSILRAQDLERLARREGRSSSTTLLKHPSMGVDMDGTPLRDQGHWMALSKRTDMVVPEGLLNVLRGQAQTATTKMQPGASVSSLFHAPASNFPSLLLDALELVWKAAYAVPSSSPSSPSASAQVHSGFGLSLLALPSGTVAALREHHALRAQKEYEAREDAAEAGEEHISPEIMRMRAAGMEPEQAGLPSLEEASTLLSHAAALPASSLPALASSPSFFPPFLAGLFRWQNWFVSRLVLSSESGAGSAKWPFNVKVTDVSNSATLMHLQLPAATAELIKTAAVGKEGDSAAKKDAAGSRYNEALVRALVGHDYRIGAVDGAPFLSVGSCVLERRRPPSTLSDPGVEALSPSLLPPLCEVHPRPVGNYSHLYYFYRRASRASAPSSVVRLAAGSGEHVPPGYVIVLTVNSGYVRLALNWLCWARRIKFSSFILLAEDQSSARIFRALGAPVIVSDSAEEELPPADYGSVSFQRTMSFRTEFLMSLLLAGVHFATADMDAVWFDDPVAFFHPLADLTGQPHKGVKLSGGFVVVRSTPSGRLFWKSVIECQRLNAAFLAERKEGTYEPSMYTEQYCINELSRHLEEKNPPEVAGPESLGDPRAFHKILPSALLFPDGKAFFDEKRSQWANVAPVVIHNNWIMGTGGKWGRMVEWNMVSIAPDGESQANQAATKLKRERRAPRVEDGEGVCAPVPVVPREPVPLRSPVALPAPSSAQDHVMEPHRFHMHVRLFLSPEASDGVQQANEFASLRRAVQALIDTDYTSAMTLASAAAATAPGSASAATVVKPSIHLEIMLDTFVFPESSRLEEARGEQAEWGRLKTELKALKNKWLERFGEPSKNGFTFVMEVKRPRAGLRVGPLGLWSLPWPKVAGSAEELESHGSDNSNATNTRHHDASLYLHDSVVLSPQWFSYAYALLQSYQLGRVPAAEHGLDDAFVDSRVYGISLLDAHMLQGETLERRLNDTATEAERLAFTEQALARSGVFNSTSAAWRRVRHLATRRAQASLPSASATPSPAQVRAQLPSSFVATRTFGFQQLSEFGALLWLPGHFDDWTAWLAEQHIPDTLSSAATLPPDAARDQVAATKCVPGLASNTRVQSAPQRTTWFEWINRWAYERGFYPLHVRATEVQVSGASSADIKAVAAARNEADAPPLKAKDGGKRLAVALTAAQAQQSASGDGTVSLLSRPLGPFDLLFPSSASVSVYDFTFHIVRAPVTLAYRSLLAPASRVDQCYRLSQYEARMDEIAAKEAAIKAAADAKKAAAKAARDAEKKAQQDAAKAVKAAAKAKADAEKAEKARQAQEKKKEAEAEAKRKKKAVDAAAAGKKEAAEEAARKKLPQRDEEVPVAEEAAAADAE